MGYYIPLTRVALWLATMMLIRREAQKIGKVLLGVPLPWQ